MSIHFGTIYTFVAFTLVPCTPLSDSYRYPLHLCLIHIGTLYTFVRFTLVAFTPLSDLLRYPLHLCLIYIGTLYTFVRFTSVPFTPLSDLHWYPLHFCLIHIGTLYTFCLIIDEEYIKFFHHPVSHKDFNGIVVNRIMLFCKGKVTYNIVYSLFNN